MISQIIPKQLFATKTSLKSQHIRGFSKIFLPNFFFSLFLTLDPRMLKLITVVFLVLFLERSEAKLYSKCELANELIEVHSETLQSATRLVCIAQYSSGYDTAFRFDDSYGIFNLSSESSKLCDIHLLYFEDENIEDDLRCAKHIYEVNYASYDYDYCSVSTEYSINECEPTHSTSVAPAAFVSSSINERFQPETEPYNEDKLTRKSPSTTTRQPPLTTRKPLTTSRIPHAQYYFFENTPPPQPSTSSTPQDIQIFTSTPQPLEDIEFTSSTTPAQSIPTSTPSTPEVTQSPKISISYEYYDDKSFDEQKQVLRKKSPTNIAKSRDNNQQKQAPRNFERQFVVQDLIKQNADKNVKIYFLFV